MPRFDILTAALPANVRVFRNTGAAYDACQTDATLVAGTVLLVPTEQVVAVAWTWPVAVTRNDGELHRLEGDPRTADLRRVAPDVFGALPVAGNLALALGWDLASFVSCMDVGFTLD